MYAVGRPHALRTNARQFFAGARLRGTPLCTSAEVLQELAHAYLSTGRLETLDAGVALVERAAVEVWPLEEADVALARRLHFEYPALQVRDLCHLASCRRRGVREIMTFERALAAISGNSTNP